MGRLVFQNNQFLFDTLNGEYLSVAKQTTKPLDGEQVLAYSYVDPNTRHVNVLGSLGNTGCQIQLNSGNDYKIQRSNTNFIGDEGVNIGAFNTYMMKPKEDHWGTITQELSGSAVVLVGNGTPRVFVQCPIRSTIRTYFVEPNIPFNKVDGYIDDMWIAPAANQIRYNDRVDGAPVYIELTSINATLHYESEAPWEEQARKSNFGGNYQALRNFRYDFPAEIQSMVNKPSIAMGDVNLTGNFTPVNTSISEYESVVTYEGEITLPLHCVFIGGTDTIGDSSETIHIQNFSATWDDVIFDEQSGMIPTKTSGSVSFNYLLLNDPA